MNTDKCLGPIPVHPRPCFGPFTVGSMTMLILLSLLSVGTVPGSELISFDSFAAPLPWVSVLNAAASSVTMSWYFQRNFVGSVVLTLSATDWSPSGGIVGLVDTLVFTSADGYFRMDNLEITREWLPSLRLMQRGSETGDRRPVQLFHE
jgi:hypothetical protein